MNLLFLNIEMDMWTEVEIDVTESETKFDSRNCTNRRNLCALLQRLLG